jgi:hypothetical protein
MDDAEAKKLQQRLIDSEIARQIERFGAASPAILKEHLLGREPYPDPRTGEILLRRGYWADQSLNSYLDSLRDMEPHLFQQEKVGSSDAAVPKLKTIFSDDQAAINRHMKEIASGEIQVVDRPNPKARSLAPNEILESDIVKVNANLKNIAEGRMRVVSQSDLDAGL